MRFFYSPGYYLPLPAGHPFPMEKFPLAESMLRDSAVLHEEEVTIVEPAAREHLLRVHTPEYLDRLARGALTSREVTVLGLPASPGLFIRSALETEGTRQTIRSALEDGCAANLAGGTHHAFADRGEGFCVLILNDVAVAVRDIQTDHPQLRTLVIDTDAHQGNGTHALLGADPHVFTYSIHVAANYPSRKVAGSLDVGLERYATGQVYLDALFTTLPRVIESFRPDLAIWVSGADPHQNDRFGQLRLTVRDMDERDAFVVFSCRSRGLALAVLYGGGYNRELVHTARLHRNSVAAARAAYFAQAV